MKCKQCNREAREDEKVSGLILGWHFVFVAETNSWLDFCSFDCLAEWDTEDSRE